MNTSTQRGVSSFFDSYAKDFSAIYGNRNTLVNRMVNHLFRGSMRIRFEKTLEGCNPVEGSRILDVGCGPGHYGIELARRGAAHVLGVDFADGMIDLANENAQAAGVQDKCTFEVRDFLAMPENEKYDYTIVMGFMDYIPEPQVVLQKALAMTSSKAFFSFPLSGGLLAWQRKLRYKSRCDLFLYDLDELKGLFDGLETKNIEVEKISRDAFVTVEV